MTLDQRSESINAVAAIKENIESFTHNARVLDHNLKHFENSVNHTFEAIDKELANAVEKLGVMAETIARQNADIRSSKVDKR